MSDSCQWPVDTSCLPEVTADNADQIRDAIDTAVMILWALTGRRFGICPAEYPVPPVSMRCGFDPRLIGGDWFNATPGSARDVMLPGPVESITAVEDDEGTLLPIPVLVGDVATDVPASARVIRYLRGEPVPPGAATRVGVLARERYLQCIGDSKCRLPRNATAVTRQGVSVQMPSPQEIIDSGSTGLPEVDIWVRAINPFGDASVSEVVL